MDVELSELDRCSAGVVRVHANEPALCLDIRQSGEREVARVRSRKDS